MKIHQAILALIACIVAVAFTLFSDPEHAVDGSSLPLQSSSRLSPKFDGRDTSSYGSYFRSAATGLWMFRADTPAAASSGAKATAAVVLVHGFSEHHQRYEHVIGHLSRSGYSVHAYDHQGHGRSEGTRGHVNDFKTMDSDLVQFIDLVIAEQGVDIPIVLFSHSMGAMLAIRYLSSPRRSPRVRAAFMSAPGIAVHPDVAVPWKIALARFLVKYVPKLPIPPKMPVERLYDHAVHDRDADPLNNLIGTRVGFAVAYLNALSEITDDRLKKVDVPVYLLHSMGDLLCEPSASKHFQTLHSNKLSKFVFPEQGKHELLQETSLWKGFLSAAVEWMDSLPLRV